MLPRPKLETALEKHPQKSFAPGYPVESGRQIATPLASRGNVRSKKHDISIVYLATRLLFLGTFLSIFLERVALVEKRYLHAPVAVRYVVAPFALAVAGCRLSSACYGSSEGILLFALVSIDTPRDIF